jgi:hypothetical protein
LVNPIPAWVSLCSWMGGLRIHVNAGFSSLGMGDLGVPGGASISHKGTYGRWPDPDEGVLTPACSHHGSGLSHALASPCSHRGSTVPLLVAISASHPSRRSALLPSWVSFSGYSEDRSVVRSLFSSYQGGVSSLSSFWPTWQYSWAFFFFCLLLSFGALSSGL